MTGFQTTFEQVFNQIQPRIVKEMQRLRKPNLQPSSGSPQKHNAVDGQVGLGAETQYKHSLSATALALTMGKAWAGRRGYQTPLHVLLYYCPLLELCQLWFLHLA